MRGVVLVRHARASCGAADHDALSELGRRRARTLGAALAAEGLAPVAAFTGTHRRHRETWDGLDGALGTALAPREHPGLDEFDHEALLAAHGAPARGRDRAAHFRALREAVLRWQHGELRAAESWAAFAARAADTLDALRAAAAALAVTSGGPIAQVLARTLELAPERALDLQLQTRNCGVTRLVAGGRGLHLLAFNETPHAAGGASGLLTHS